ncbi:NUDIX domain-containing protein [Candidatus Woesearchaeota archaeon]|nr:NUDIX domain-containing protein [Candidatus Woesearchaeota archaeon]
MFDKTKREKIINLIGVVLRDGNKVLLLQRNKQPYQGYWGFPGGKMEYGEHVADTAVRECFEETGIHAQFEKVCGIATEIIREQGKVVGHFVIFLCKLGAKDFQVKE